MILADPDAIREREENLPEPTQDQFPTDTRSLDEMLDGPPPPTFLEGVARQAAPALGVLANPITGTAVPLGDAARGVSDELRAPGGGHAVASAFLAGVARAQEVDNIDADRWMLSRAYQPVLEALNRARPRVEQIPNAYSSANVYDWMVRRYGPIGLAAARQAWTNEVWAQVNELRQSDPPAVANIPATHAQLLDEVLAEQRAALSWGDVTATHGNASRAAGFVGTLVGGFTDPSNVLASVMGAPASASLLKTFVIEGGLNTALDVAGLPSRAARYRKLGAPMNAGEIGGELAADFVLGGAIPTGIKAGLRAVSPDVRTAARVVEDELYRADENPHAGDAGGRDLMRQGALTAMGAIQDGRPDLLPDTTAQLGRALDPKIEAARRRQGFSVESFDPAKLETDAAAMQYKGGGDAHGVTDRLQGVTQWDPAKAGLSLIWERGDGTLIVADGHQRLGLAKRLMAAGQDDVTLYGIRYREADGFTAQDMRVVAALKNIAEGTGTGLDAARLLREAPEGIESLPPRSPLVRQARDMTGLSDDAFGMALNGTASERDAAIVGRFVRDKDLQAPILAHLAKDSPDTAEEAELFVRQVLAAGATREVQSDMFGDFIKADLILPQRVKILKGALTSLRKDKALFSTLTDRADAIQAAGNALNTVENEARRETAARAFATLKALAERKGPISDALQEAAEAAARTGNRRAATGRFIQNVRDAVARGDFDRADAGGPVGTLEPSPEDFGLSPGAEAETDAAASPVLDPAAVKAGLSGFDDPVGKPEAFVQQSRVLAASIAPEDIAARARAVQADFIAAQKGRSLEDLFKNAPARQRELDTAGEAIARETGTRWKSGGVKERATAQAKMTRKKYPDAGRMTDITRGAFLLDAPDEAEAVVDALARHFDVLDEGWAQQSSGFFDRKLLVRFADGEAGEVQLRAAMMDAAVRAGGHKAFRVSRDLTLPAAEREAARGRERELYSAAIGRLDPAWAPVLAQAGNGGSVPKVLLKFSGDISPPSYRSSQSTSFQSSPGSGMKAARLSDSSRMAGRQSQFSKTSMGDTSEPNVGAAPAEVNPSEFGPAQPEIEALRRMDQDVTVPDPDGDGDIAVRDLRRRLERQARAVEALRNCGGFDAV
jgi:hypothetical protein